ncbi:hypothetical protein RHMOL_Rhmol01G0225000 [Rhododendron molle]|uniref:Uncharacterized protein n=1 Tax=Rhododendron molle TaxID=49168 RepID=A0ACC0Q7F6_RHOML|nr:hypothetical protein RHMOL_Rhmol01G0225000 [Rhododendron molle]
MIKHQLEQTQAKMSVWDVLVHSTRHREGLIQALSQLKVPSAITPDELVALIKTIPIKHASTFTDRDLPAEGTDHNRWLHITLKCHDKWVPVILVDNGSAINVCPLRICLLLEVYQGKPEPFWDKETNTLLPGFEIFANDVWPESEEEFEAVEEQKEPVD